MLVYATVTEKTIRNITLDIPDDEYTDKELHEMAESGELLCCGDVVGEEIELANELTSIEIDDIEKGE